MVLRGSPPHTWRIRNRTDGQERTLGITSTYVENTQIKKFLGSDFGDHLHIRGEYFHKWVDGLAKWGSPPHTWRILAYRSCHLVQYRITSTYVENTFYQYLLIVEFRDHLHIRGEYILSISANC